MLSSITGAGYTNKKNLNQRLHETKNGTKVIPQKYWRRQRYRRAHSYGSLGSGSAKDASGQARDSAAPLASGHRYNSAYTGDNLNRIAFPMGGMGAGMFCLEGTGLFRICL